MSHRASGASLMPPARRRVTIAGTPTPGSVMRHTATAVLLAGALLASSCTGGGAGPDDPAAGAVVVSDEPGALEAMADTLSGSFRWTGRLDLTLDRDEVVAALEHVEDAADEPLLPETGDELLTEVDRWEELARDLSTRGALADDGSWQLALAHGGDTWLDLRFGLGEIMDAQTMTPEAAILARVGWDALFRMVEDTMGESRDAWDVRGEMRRTATEGPDAGTPFSDVLLALAEGGWGGLSGTVDLAQLGIAADDLDDHAQQLREDVAGVADRDTMLELADEALTIRGYERRGDLTVATVDVHPRAAAFAIYDLFDDAAMLADVPDDSLPETVEGVATVAFDDQGRLVEVRTDVLTLSAAVLDAEADRYQRIADGEITVEDGGWVPAPDVAAASAARSRAAAEAVRDLETTTAAVVFTMSDHGQVPTVTDVEAVTMPWGELAELFFGGLHEPSRPEAPLPEDGGA